MATEIMMFGALFLGLALYRVTWPAATAEASRHLLKWIGAANTAVLLTSSLTMALAVLAARADRQGRCVLLLLATAALGLAFLGIKAYEYHDEYTQGLMPFAGPGFPLQERGTELFFDLYYLGTGLHALHLAVGIVLVGGLALRLLVDRALLPDRAVTVAVIGIFWHLIDIVWIFLFPVLYLVAR